LRWQQIGTSAVESPLVKPARKKNGTTCQSAGQ
jgi:hypothetical protein